MRLPARCVEGCFSRVHYAKDDMVEHFSKSSTGLLGHYFRSSFSQHWVTLRNLFQNTLQQRMVRPVSESPG